MSTTTTSELSSSEPRYVMDGPGARFLRRWIWWIGGLTGVAFITVMRFLLIHRPEPPPVLTRVPDFALIDETGARFDGARMDGKVWIVGFVFTRCKSICPPISAAMVRMQEHVLRSRLGDHIGMLTVSVDPEYDTPERLSQYADALGADTSHWHFLTGPVPDVERFVVDGFKLAVGERQEREPGVFDIAHSSRLALVDKRRGLRGLYGLDDESLEELYQTAIVLIRVD